MDLGTHLGSPGGAPGSHFGALGGPGARFLQDFNHLFGNIVLRGFLEVIFFDFSRFWVSFFDTFFILFLMSSE